MCRRGKYVVRFSNGKIFPFGKANVWSFNNQKKKTSKCDKKNVYGQTFM